MTNIIEQLGGYEKAKECLNTRTARLSVINELRAALLEYRRQHNIYEEGDWIIYDDELMVFAMWSKHHNEYAYIGYANADDGALEHRSAFRHATDEEITVNGDEARKYICIYCGLKKSKSFND